LFVLSIHDALQRGNITQPKLNDRRSLTAKKKSEAGSEASEEINKSCDENKYNKQEEEEEEA